MLYIEGAPDDLPNILNQVSRLIEVLVASFGAWGTIGICVFLLLLFLGYRLYNEKKKDWATNELLKEKDRTIQRLSVEARNYKILFFKQSLGWSDEQIELLMIKNEYEDVVTARKALEGEETPAAAKALKRKATRRSRKEESGDRSSKMTAITILVILLVLWAIKELIVSLVLRRKRKELVHKLRVECTQRHFAEARNQLMQLVIENKLSTESETFRDLYHLNTGIMRRPDYYPAIGYVLGRTILKGNNEEVDDTLLSECKNWTPEIRAVVVATADAMSYLIINHSRTLRVVYWVEKKLNPRATPTALLRRLSESAEKASGKTDPVVKKIRRTQTAMYQMARAY